VVLVGAVGNRVSRSKPRCFNLGKKETSASATCGPTQRLDATVTILQMKKHRRPGWIIPVHLGVVVLEIVAAVGNSSRAGNSWAPEVLVRKSHREARREAEVLARKSPR
jgi:hypothetical protein